MVKKRKVKKSRKKKRKVKKSRKVKRTKRIKRRKSSKRRKIFKSPLQSKDNEGNTIIKVSDSWANQAYVNGSKYKKKIQTFN